MICKSISLIHLNLKTLFMSISISNHHQMTFKSAYGNMDRQRVNFWYLFNKLTLVLLAFSLLNNCTSLHPACTYNLALSNVIRFTGIWLSTNVKHWSTSVYYNKHAHKLSFHIRLKIPREVMTTSLLPSNDKISH